MQEFVRDNRILKIDRLTQHVRAEVQAAGGRAGSPLVAHVLDVDTFSSYPYPGSPACHAPLERRGVCMRPALYHSHNLMISLAFSTMRSRPTAGISSL